MNRIQTKKLKGILPVVGIILFIGAIALSLSNGERQFIGYLWAASYFFIAWGVFYARKLSWAILFVFLLAMIPMFDMWGGGQRDALGMLIDGEETFFTMWGNFGISIFSFMAPCILFVVSVFKLKLF